MAIVRPEINETLKIKSLVVCEDENKSLWKKRKKSINDFSSNIQGDPLI